MNEPKRVSLVWVLLAALVAVIIVFDVAYASGDEVIQSNDMNTAGNVGGIRSYAVGGADVDINDYYRSYSYLFGLIQETKSNPLAVARDLMVEGNYEAAAVLRCKPWGVHKAFGGRTKCEAALSKPAINPTPPKTSGNDEDEDDEHEESLEPIYARLSAIEAYKAQDAEEARKSAKRAEMYAQEAKQIESERVQRAQADLASFQGIINE